MITTVAEVEAALDKLHALERQMRAAEIKRDQSIDYYRQRIDDARKIFNAEAAAVQFDMNGINAELKTFFDENPPLRGKTLKFAGGNFGYHKQGTRYKFGDSEADADNPDLLNFVKNGHEDFLRVKESVDWAKLRNNLVYCGDNVYLKSTGELIPDMRAIPQPDKFVVKTDHARGLDDEDD